MPRVGKQKQLPDGKFLNTLIFVKVTHNFTEFIELPPIDGNDGTIIRCVPCSEHLGAEHHLRRAGLAGHQKATKHKRALLWCEERKEHRRAIDRNVRADLAKIAILPHVLLSHTQPTAPQLEFYPESCLDNLELDDNGLLTDGTGMPIMLGAGQDPGAKADMDLQAELENFCLYGHLNPRTSVAGEDLEGMFTMEEDMPLITAQLAAMGQ